MLDAANTPFYNPDTETLALLAANPGLTLNEANAVAWHCGKDLLEALIAGRLSFNFETTPGGTTITRLLMQAHAAGLRVRERVRLGGHDIPEPKIRERYDAGRNNLCSLLPALDELVLYDNSLEADPRAE